MLLIISEGRPSETEYFFIAKPVSVVVILTNPLSVPSQTSLPLMNKDLPLLLGRPEESVK